MISQKICENDENWEQSECLFWREIGQSKYSLTGAIAFSDDDE